MMQYSYRLWLLLLICFCFSTSDAQKRQYTMAEAVNGIATTLAPKSAKQPSWEPGTHNFYQVVVANGSQYLLRNDAAGKGMDTVSSVRKFREDIGADKEIGAFDPLEWVGKGRLIMKNGRFLQLWSAEPNGTMHWSNYAELPADAANVTLDRSMNVAYTLQNNLWLLDKNKAKIQITAEPDKNIINGQAVHRNEFGIDKGIFFSPRGSYLAYYRMDQTMVEDYPVIDWSVTPAKNENVKYPMAGRKSHEVTLQVYNIMTKQTIQLKTCCPADHYLTCITWSPDEKYVYVGVLNREQNDLQLCRYSAVTGELVKTILEEKDNKYVEPQHPLSFLPGSNNQFIWWSQRDGYMHLWLCDMAKNSMRCLTPGAYVVNDLIGFNLRTKEVLLTSANEDPREKHGYAVNWETGKMRRLDTEPGTHNYTASDDGEYLFDVYSCEQFRYSKRNNHTLEGEAYTDQCGVSKKSIIRNIKSEIVKVIMDSPDPLQDYKRPQVTDYTLKAQDGTTLYGKLILPTNFDANKKYPVIVYLYNGPHVQLVKNGFPESGNLWYEYLAQHGYIVWTMDGRGSSNRGLKFEQATFRKLGTVEMEDQLKGVEFLKSLPYVDTTRMGVHGWSFGGFMTTSLMLRHPGVFKCAVAGGPVMDWSMYEVMYGERYMDTPEENPEGYKESTLFDKVKNLKGKLLLIHGTQDATVVWQHSVKFLKACVDNGVQVDYFIYPGYEHNVRGKDRVHLMQKITDYFDQNL